MKNNIFHILERETINYKVPELDMEVIIDSKDNDIIEIHLEVNDKPHHKYYELNYDEMIALNAIFNKILQKKER